MKPNYKKIFTLVILVAAVFQLALACSPNTGTTTAKKIELVIWKPFETEGNLRPIFDAYTKIHPNVTFRYEKKDITTYQKDLIDALAAGSGPDIFSIHNDWLPQYQNKMAPAPDGLFSSRELGETYVDVIRDDLVDPGTGKLYGLPLAMDVLALYYNRDLLGSAGIAQPPQTWAELVSDVKKLTRQDKLGNFITNGLAIGTASNVYRASDILSLLMLQNGTQIYNPGRSATTLDREVVSPDGSRYNPGVQALDFYTQFANPAKETYTWNARNNQSIDAFVAGQSAMMLAYSFSLPTIREKAPLLKFGIAPVPQIDLSKPKVNFANYFAEGVSKASPNAAAAWDFLKFSTKSDQLKAYYSLHKQAAVRKDMIPAQISDADIGVFAEGALTAKTFYKPDAGAVESILVRMIEDVILRNKSSSQSVGAANQLLTNLLR